MAYDWQTERIQMASACAELHCTSAEKLIGRLDKASIKLALLDPPYGIGFDGGKGWDTFTDAESYLGWCKTWLEALEPAIMPGGIIVIFSSFKSPFFWGHNAIKPLAFISMTPIIWHYNWGGRPKNNFADKAEPALVFSKGKHSTFNAEAVQAERKQKSNIRTGKAYDKGTIPTNVWLKNKHTMSKEHCKWHPTAKPLAVLQRFIKAYTNEGDTVADFFSGSGSTCIASLQTGRNFIGSELDADYFAKSLLRINSLLDYSPSQIA